jgi:hypothetical protein
VNLATNRQAAATTDGDTLHTQSPANSVQQDSCTWTPIFWHWHAELSRTIGHLSKAHKAVNIKYAEKYTHMSTTTIINESPTTQLPSIRPEIFWSR